jgi:hypothetical protein
VGDRLLLDAVERHRLEVRTLEKSPTTPFALISGQSRDVA